MTCSVGLVLIDPCNKPSARRECVALEPPADLRNTDHTMLSAAVGDQRPNAHEVSRLSVYVHHIRKHILTALTEKWLWSGRTNLEIGVFLLCAKECQGSAKLA